MTRRTRVLLAAVTFVLIASVAVAWVLENRASSSSPAGSPGAYHVRVTKHGRQLAAYDLQELKAFGMRKVVVQGGAEEGPALLDVLTHAGVSDFGSLTILGPGQRDSGRLELKASDVGPDTVLDVAKRGTVKIAGPSIPRNKRVRDITEIQVK